MFMKLISFKRLSTFCANEVIRVPRLEKESIFISIMKRFIVLYISKNYFYKNALVVVRLLKANMLRSWTVIIIQVVGNALIAVL